MWRPSFETTSLKECGLASALMTAVVVNFWVVATSRVMTSVVWVALVMATGLAAMFIARRLWLVARERGLEWSRADWLTMGAWQVAMLLAFWLTFFGRLAPRA